MKTIIIVSIWIGVLILDALETPLPKTDPSKYPAPTSCATETCTWT